MGFILFQGYCWVLEFFFSQFLITKNCFADNPSKMGFSIWFYAQRYLFSWLYECWKIVSYLDSMVLFFVCESSRKFFGNNYFFLVLWEFGLVCCVNTCIMHKMPNTFVITGWNWLANWIFEKVDVFPEFLSV